MHSKSIRFARLLGIFGACVVDFIPAALWLFSSGLVGLIGMARRKAA